MAKTVASDPARQVLITVANPFSPALEGAGSTWKGWSWSGGYHVASNVAQKVNAIADDYALRQTDAWAIGLLDVYCVVFELAEHDNRSDVVRALNRDARVVLAQPLQEFETQTTDSREKKERDRYRDLQHSVIDLDLVNAHTVSTGRGVRIAVIDTGAQLDHPEIADQIAQSADYVERDRDEFSDDIHGTAIVGIIGATGGNREGILGVATDSEIVVLKACWPAIEGKPLARCNSFTLARAVAAAVDMNADIVNLSLFGPADPLLDQIVRAAIDTGVIVVGAEPEDGNGTRFPTAIPGVIAAQDASHWSRSPRNVFPAPGTDVITTVPIAGYEYLSGSSLAAAHVTGIIALLKQVDANLSGKRTVEILRSSVRKASHSDYCLNACAAVAILNKSLGCGVL